MSDRHTTEGTFPRSLRSRHAYGLPSALCYALQLGTDRHTTEGTFPRSLRSRHAYGLPSALCYALQLGAIGRWARLAPRALRRGGRSIGAPCRALSVVALAPPFGLAAALSPARSARCAARASVRAFLPGCAACWRARPLSAGAARN